MNFLRISPIQVLRVGLFTPEGDEVGHIVDRIGGFVPAIESKPLASHFVGTKPIVMITLCGYGDKRGFFSNSTKKTSTPRRLPDDWWKHGSQRRVCLFAFSCNSYEYLHSSSAMQHLSGAIGFSGYIWLHNVECSKRMIRRWARFLDKVRELVEEQVVLDQDALAKLRDLYENKIEHLGGMGFLRAFWREEDYVMRMCLMKQMRRLRLV